MDVGTVVMRIASAFDPQGVQAAQNAVNQFSRFLQIISGQKFTNPQAIKELEDRLVNARLRVKELVDQFNQFKSAQEEIKAINKILDGMGDVISGKTTKELDSLRAKLKTLQSEMAAVNANPQGTQGTLGFFKGLQEEISAVSKKIAESEQRLSTFDRLAGRLDQLQGFVNKNQGVAKSLSEAATETNKLESALARLRSISEIRLPDFRQFLSGQMLVSLSQIPPAIARSISSFGQFVSVGLSGLSNLSNRILQILNPINLMGGAFRSVGEIVRIAFGVLLGNALTELTRKALELINSLSPLTTGLLAGQVDTSLRALAVTAANTGKSFGEVSDAVNVLRGAGIKANEAIQSISQGLQIGLSPEQVQRLSRAAQDLAVVLGSDSTEAFQRLFRAVVTGQSDLLRFAGIMKTGEQLIAEFARTHGKSAQEVRNNTLLMRQAFVEGILNEAQKFSGVYEASLTELQKRIGSFSRIFQDLQIGIGQVFVPILSAGLGGVEELTEQLSRLFFITKRQSGENYGKVIAQGLTDANKEQAALNGQASGFTQVQNLTQKQVFSLSAAFEKYNATAKDGGEKATEAQEELNTVLKNVSEATGATEEQLTKLGTSGALAFETIIKAGKAFDPSPLAVRLYAANKALGELFETGIKASLKNLFGGIELEDTADRAIQFGINFVAGFANGILGGINQYLIPALVSIADIIVSFLGIHSPAEEGPLSEEDPSEYGANYIKAIAQGIEGATGSVTSAAGGAAQSIIDSLLQPQFLTSLQEYGRTIARSILEGFKLQDFSELNFLGGIAQQLLTSGQNDTQGLQAAERSRGLIAQALGEIRNSGSVAAGTLSQLQAVLGAAFGDFVKYFNLLGQLTDEEKQQTENEKKVADAKLAIAAAQDKVREATERLRQFELDTADIPERYTRGRRQQLEQELDAAQQEEDRRRRAAEQLSEQIQAQEDANKKVKEQLALQRALIQELARQAEAQENINRLTREEPIPTPVAIEENIKKLDALAGEFVEKYKQLFLNAFKPVEDQFNKIVSFVRGLLGQGVLLPTNFSSLSDADKRRVLEQLTPLNEAGKNLRESLTTIGGAVSTAFAKLIEFFQSEDFKNGIQQLLDFVKNPTVQKGILILVGFGLANAVTGGGLTAIITSAITAAGFALASTPVGWGIALGVVLYFSTDIASQILTKTDVDNFWADINKGGQETTNAIGKLILTILANINIPLILGKAAIGTIARTIDEILRKFNVDTPQLIKDLIHLSTLSNTDYIKGVGELIKGGVSKAIPGLSSTKTPAADLTPDPNTLNAYDQVLSEIRLKLINSGVPTTVAQYITDPTKVAFQTLSDDLVGKSIVPDMITGILAQFTRGSVGTISTVSNMARAVSSIFSNMASNILRTIAQIITGIFGLTRTMTTFVAQTNSLMSLFVAAFLRAGSSLRSILLSIQGAFFSTANIVEQIWTQMLITINRLNSMILTSITNTITNIVGGFNGLYDRLVRRSIVPDMVNDIVGEFAALNPRTSTPLEAFRKMVEEQIGSIDAGMNLGRVPVLAGGSGGDGKRFNITVDQSGWVFPANMDEAQKDQFRRIAREEAYQGIVTVFEKVKT